MMMRVGVYRTTCIEPGALLPLSKHLHTRDPVVCEDCDPGPTQGSQMGADGFTSVCPIECMSVRPSVPPPTASARLFTQLQHPSLDLGLKGRRDMRIMM